MLSSLYNSNRRRKKLWQGRKWTTGGQPGATHNISSRRLTVSEQQEEAVAVHELAGGLDERRAERTGQSGQH
jgi:hypothetical protein